jgi:RNA polymerase sigma-70 factor (ECF subfamily)
LSLAAEHEASFTEFYEAERAAVFRTAFLITTDREEARDLTQEAFVRAFERWHEVSAHERPGAWLQTVVARLAISWRRREVVRRRRALNQRDERTVEMKDPEGAVLDALRALSQAQRAVVVLRFYADLSVRDVARALGKREGTVKALTAQAVARLRPLLEARGVRS